jgi:GNAT superfamily N-acetyltransferase
LDENDLPLACGAFKKYADDIVEIKRMYVHPDHRRHGLASTVLTQLERWAKELGFEYALLETGEFLPGTVAFYKKCGYSIIPNYDQYVGIEGSICFKKTL